MTLTANLGFPRIGVKRELKRTLESFWKGKSLEDDLQNTARELRARHWNLQKDAGIDIIPSNDFSFYDQVLDMSATVGAVPTRYNFSGDTVDLTTYFAMARGHQADGQDVKAMEMTKWFDTNYHYIVPEFETDQTFKLTSSKYLDEFLEAKALGITTRPVLIGPVTYLLLGKMQSGEQDTIALLPALLPVYEQMLKNLKDAGATHVQMDEPCLVLDLTDKQRAALQTAYARLSKAGLSLTLATYFGGLKGANLQTALSLPVQNLHLDLVRAPEQLTPVLDALPSDKTLSLGIVDGRNIWKTDFEKAQALAAPAIQKLGEDRVIFAPSCSLLHTPVDLDEEVTLDDPLKSWLAFATQKLTEITVLAKNDQMAFTGNQQAMDSRRNSEHIHNKAVQERFNALTPRDLERQSPFEARILKQRDALNLPLLPTTTIGSLPQTQDVRQARAQFKKGTLSAKKYQSFLEQKTEEAIRFQEERDIDVLVHGEFERNDMVEYFGEQLEGFAFTKNGWVQSYGSRCVKPPVIYGDVSRPAPMTVGWAKYAQNLTNRLLKGMLTGPVTILQWSFVRDDQPREVTCKQIALAIRDEVIDLEAAGIKIIQIDEPAIREGLPLNRADWEAYLKWAVDSFRISASGVRDETQIHTHMCYAEFNDIINAISDMDADVISIETSRSAMELLGAFVSFKYPNEIGPGVYDIHSPRIPSTDEMEALLLKALEVLKPEQVWVNPDCGLKTRGWEEVKPALTKMVSAAKNIRAKLQTEQQQAQAS